jgi:hypothetical protein
MLGIISPTTLQFIAPDEHTQQGKSDNLKYRIKYFPKRKIFREMLQRKMKHEEKISS